MFAWGAWQVYVCNEGKKDKRLVISLNICADVHPLCQCTDIPLELES